VSGAVVGAILGAQVGFEPRFGFTSMLVGALAGALIFGYISMRWGDTAWQGLGSIFFWWRR
jgi:hypothetical protein